MNPTTAFDRSAHFSPPEAARAAWERDAKHIARFFELLQGGADAAKSLEELYLIRVDKQVLWELIGLRVRGHPTVILGAVEMARHTGSTAPHGRIMMGQFLSKPPRQPAVQGHSLPPGLIRVAMPQLTESMPEFFERIRATTNFGPLLQVDAELIDFAFDFRTANPSELEHLKSPPGTVSVSAFRTNEGHVLTATGHGLYYTLQRDANFVTITDVIQHRPNQSRRLPTLCLNRKYIALERQVSSEDLLALDTLAFHPATATDYHLFGPVCDELLG